MAKNIEQLYLAATAIRDEQKSGGVTAEQVGQLFYDIIDYIKDNGTGSGSGSDGNSSGGGSGTGGSSGGSGDSGGGTGGSSNSYVIYMYPSEPSLNDTQLNSLYIINSSEGYMGIDRSKTVMIRDSSGTAVRTASLSPFTSDDYAEHPTWNANTRGAKLVLNTPIAAGDLTSGSYTITIPAGTVGDENFYKHLTDSSITSYMTNETFNKNCTIFSTGGSGGTETYTFETTDTYRQYSLYPDETTYLKNSKNFGAIVYKKDGEAEHTICWYQGSETEWNTYPSGLKAVLCVRSSTQYHYLDLGSANRYGEIKINLSTLPTWQAVEIDLLTSDNQLCATALVGTIRFQQLSVIVNGIQDNYRYIECASANTSNGIRTVSIPFSTPVKLNNGDSVVFYGIPESYSCLLSAIAIKNAFVTANIKWEYDVSGDMQTATGETLSIDYTTSGVKVTVTP